MSKMESEKMESVFSPSGNREEDEKILRPHFYGLQVREKFKLIAVKSAAVFDYWLKIPQDKLIAIDEIIQMLYTAGLLLDDIQDNTTMRGGIPVAHSVYSIGSTLNAVNYVIFIGLEKIISWNNREAIEVYNEQVLELFRGQGIEIYWRDNFVCPSEEEYKAMAIRKTGGLFMMMVRLMQLFSDNKSNFKKLIELLGFYFQIMNDYYNLRSAHYTSTKGYCEDLTEGKFGFPIIHGIQSHPEDSQIFDILRQRTTDIEVKRYCVTLLEKFGSFRYTRNILSDIDKELRAEVAKLGDNPLMMSMIDDLLRWKSMTENT